MTDAAAGSRASGHTPAEPSSWGSRTAPFAGPVAIVVATVLILHDFAFSSVVNLPHPDVLPLWLPTHCFLGNSLAAGNIPAWNPHVMAGIPFAADPQSGWMYLPAMTLYAALPCDIALRGFVLLQPILGGLGIYAFLRVEGLGRPAASVAGLILALSVSGSLLAVSLPFSGTLAWIALTLAAASRFVRAQGASRWVWAGLTAGAWGQIAAAHFGYGIVMGTLALGLYLVADWRRASATGDGRAAIRRAGILVALLPAVNLAYLLPRLAYLPRVSLPDAYGRLDVLATVPLDPQLARGVVGPGIDPSWLLSLFLGPGLYLGALTAVMMFAAWRAPGRRPLAAAFTALAAACAIVSLDPIAKGLGSVLPARAFGFYFHEPARFALVLPLALAVLAALGVEAWLAEVSARRRVRMLLPGAAVLVAAVLLSASLAYSVLPLLGSLVAGTALWRVHGRASFAAILPVVVLIDLGAGGLAPRPDALQAAEGRVQPVLRASAFPIDLGGYLADQGFANDIGERDTGRYLSLDRAGWDARGYHLRQAPQDWPLMGGNRSMLLGLEEAQGYNSLQLERYWRYVRSVDRRYIRYNAAGFLDPPQSTLDLLQVGWVIAPTDEAPVPGAREVRTIGRWSLYRLRSTPRATVFTAWDVLPSAEEARNRVRRRRFDPSERLILESDPGAEPTALNQPGRARYVALSGEEAVVEVDSPAPAVLLIRSSWDPSWRATVDGRDVPVVPADYFLQGVAIPAGTSTVELRFEDPWIGRGLAGSGITLLVLAAAAIRASRRSRRTSGPAGGGASR